MATNANAAAKYRDVISRSVLIRRGPPTVFQLRTKKRRIDTLTKITIGERNVNVLNKTILLVGETGTGKSTLINALVNYAMGVKWEDDVWFQIVEEKKTEEEEVGMEVDEDEDEDEELEGDQTESQTSDVIVYQIFGFERPDILPPGYDKPYTLPYSLTIIDTPGYGDTRGMEKDDLISQRLLDWFRSDGGVNEINTVGLVLKESVNRVSERLRYVFDSVVSLFGKNMEKNIVTLMTHSTYLPPKNALKALKSVKIKCAKDATKKDPIFFQFNNCQSDAKTPETEFALKVAWDFTAEQVRRFTVFLTQAAPQKLNTSADVLNERDRLRACIKNLRERVEFIEGKEREVQQERAFLRRCEENMKENENYTEDVVETFKKKQTIEGGRWGFLWLNYKAATSCLVCEETCHHEGCTHASGPDDSRCTVMKNGHCTVCTKKCSTKCHVKEEWIYVTATRTVTVTKEDVKKKYEENKAESQKKLSVLEQLNKLLEERKREKDRCLDETYQHVLKLEAIALNVDSLSTYVHLEFLIERMKEKRDTPKLQKLEEMRNRMIADKGTKAAVEYMCSRRAAAN